MRNTISSTLLLLATLLAAPAAAQDAYPARPVTLVVPSPAGGTTDVTARIFAKKLQEILGQPFLVDNRAGANGYIGTQSVLRGPKDGYQLIVMSGSLHSFTPAMVEKMPFDPIEDFALVSKLISYPFVLVTSARLPFQNVADIVKAGKEPNSKLSYGSYGVGSSPHLITEWFKLRTGVDAVHVPYKGGGQAASDSIGGQISMMFASLPAATAQIKAGQVRALAITSARRHDAFPNVPAAAESLPGFEATSWLGLAAPKGTPAAVTEKLRKALEAAVKDPAVVAQLEAIGGEPNIDASSRVFHEFLLAEKKKWDMVVRDAKIPKEKE
jgi:tripartite-type tricarboxylate transporter receptor subunit TctC